MEISGLAMFLLGFLTVALIYGVAAIGVNINWGYTGLFNVGVAGFFAIGAYTSALVTVAPTDRHFGGFAMPVVLGVVLAMLFAAAMAWAIGKVCLRLRADYLAIATIGIAEIIRLVFKNWNELANSAFGVTNVPRPFVDSFGDAGSKFAYLAMMIVILLVLYWCVQRAWNSPWGRVLRAIRENEQAAAAAGKNVEAFRLQAFVLGSAIMGLFGALYVHYFRIIAPEATEPLEATFLPWVMLIIGGSGNNKGAILGAILVWGLWTLTELMSNFLPDDWALRVAYLRVFLVGFLLQVVLQKFPGGLLPEKAPVAGRRRAAASS